MFVPTSYPGPSFSGYELGKEGPGKRWSRVRQILQESWSISPRAGFVEIMTGGKGKVRERTMAI